MDWASCYVPEPRSDHDAHFGVADLGVIGPPCRQCPDGIVLSGTQDTVTAS